MALEVFIYNITGTSPYDIYICQSGGTGCFYIETLFGGSTNFIIPPPYDQSSSYMVKVIDANGCVISGVKNAP